MFSSIPTGNLTDLSASCKDILVGLMSPSLSFSQIDKGIRLTLSPKSHRSLSMTDFPIQMVWRNYQDPLVLEACYFELWRYIRQLA